MTPDLQTRYLGLDIPSPVVASASPLTGELASLREIAGAGAGAVVLPSLFEEQIVHESFALEQLLEGPAATNPEAADGYFPQLDEYNAGVERYLRHLEAAVSAVDVPVIASLNGVSRGGWLRYASQLEAAGASALELNVYRVAASVDDDPRDIEHELVDLVRAVCSSVAVPVAVKLGPYYTAFGHLASQLEGAGAAGLVLFNRFYQPDIDVETRAVSPRLVLSTPVEQLLPLRWVALLHGRVRTSLAVTSGVHDGRGVAKALLAGADVAMTTSALLLHGPGHLRLMLGELRQWMTEYGYESVDQLRGSASQRAVADDDADAFERANYLQTLTGYHREAGPLRV